MAQHNETGKKGEELAIAFLTEKGFTVIEKNWISKHLEIDIIAQKKELLIIAEVKTRTGSYFGEPEEFVNKQKQKNLIKAAQAYIEKQNLDLEVRFDIISIVFSPKNNAYKIHHIEDAFYAM